MRAARVRDQDACPCGGGRTFGGCCAPFLGGEIPTTAEQLMRSRYSAFVVGDDAYLRDTWHPGTRPAELVLDPQQRWTALEVVDTAAGAEGDRRGVVEFRAHWREGGARGVLHERSRFVHQSARWWYLDGEIRPDA
ncbi:YchJ family metal-binding protein [Microbacterium sp. NPDC089189]|uniref:YchJ family protein n=1 Tax=Microbacterium sp. NPDC089189 TaxID=3154972 RepID=UPI003427435F